MSEKYQIEKDEGISVKKFRRDLASLIYEYENKPYEETWLLRNILKVLRQQLRYICDCRYCRNDACGRACDDLITDLIFD